MIDAPSPTAETRGRLLAVDGNSLAHRAFHAQLRDEPTGHFVTDGFVRMLATAWREGPFDAVVIAFDGPDNIRRTWYAGYKAHREDHDPRLEAAIAALPEHLEACGFTIVGADGVEADDWLAAIADSCSAAAVPAAVLSSDRDLLALVSEHVRLLRPIGSMAALRVYDPARVRTEFGVEPSQYRALAALRGDPSDGLDGVHGIGPKTAAKLLRRYGSIEAMYGALCNLPPRTEAALRAGRPNVERNLRLMAPLPDLEVDLDAVLGRRIDGQRAASALTALGCGYAAGRLLHTLERPPAPPMPPPPDSPMDALDDPAPAAGRSGAGRLDRELPARLPAVAAAAVGEQVALF